MNETLQALLILQERDIKLHTARTDLEQIPKDATKIKAALTAKVQALEVAKQAQLEAEKAVKAVELDINTRKETITKLKMRQGETKRNEEYQMLGHEIIRYGDDIDELETKELELMEVVDLKKAEREAAKEGLANEKQFATEQSQVLIARKKNAELKIQEVAGDREEKAKNVDPDALALYERIFKQRGAGAIARVSQTGKCEGCNIKLPPADVHRLMAGNDLVQCSECSRLLYLA